MATLENVERLRERANVTYEEAKEALEACGDDLLDAVIYLEGKGKVAAPIGGGSYSSDRQAPPPEYDHIPKSPHEEPKGETFGQVMGRFFKFCGKIIDKGNKNMFDVWRNGQVVFSLPVTVLVVLMILFFWVVIPAAIVGLFFGFRYRFSGRDLDDTVVNKAMDSAAHAADTLKEEFKATKDDHHQKDESYTQDEEK